VKTRNISQPMVGQAARDGSQGAGVEKRDRESPSTVRKQSPATIRRQFNFEDDENEKKVVIVAAEDATGTGELARDSVKVLRTRIDKTHADEVVAEGENTRSRVVGRVEWTHEYTKVRTEGAIRVVNINLRWADRGAEKMRALSWAAEALFGKRSDANWSPAWAVVEHQADDGPETAIVLFVSVVVVTSKAVQSVVMGFDEDASIRDVARERRVPRGISAVLVSEYGAKPIEDEVQAMSALSWIGPPCLIFAEKLEWMWLSGLRSKSVGVTTMTKEMEKNGRHVYTDERVQSTLQRACEDQLARWRSAQRIGRRNEGPAWVEEEQTRASDRDADESAPRTPGLFHVFEKKQAKVEAPMTTNAYANLTVDKVEGLVARYQQIYQEPLKNLRELPRDGSRERTRHSVENGAQLDRMERFTAELREENVPDEWIVRAIRRTVVLLTNTAFLYGEITNLPTTTAVLARMKEIFCGNAGDPNLNALERPFVGAMESLAEAATRMKIHAEAVEKRQSASGAAMNAVQVETFVGNFLRAVGTNSQPNAKRAALWVTPYEVRGWMSIATKRRLSEVFKEIVDFDTQMDRLDARVRLNQARGSRRVDRGTNMGPQVHFASTGGADDWEDGSDGDNGNGDEEDEEGDDAREQALNAFLTRVNAVHIDIMDHSGTIDVSRLSSDRFSVPDGKGGLMALEAFAAAILQSDPKRCWSCGNADHLSNRCPKRDPRLPYRPADADVYQGKRTGKLYMVDKKGMPIGNHGKDERRLQRAGAKIHEARYNMHKQRSEGQRSEPGVSHPSD
jgi:hypothetical protein